MPEKNNVVQYTLENGVGRLCLNRPESLNALNLEAIRALRDIAAAAAVDTQVRALLITGTGRAFCAGGDIKQMLSGWISAGPGRSRTAALDGAGDLHQAISTLHRMPKPVICAVNGPAAGAGVGLALAGDIVVAARSASFTLAYTTIALSPDGGTTFFLPRAVGSKLAADLLLTNRTLSADEACHAGLVSRVVADDDLPSMSTQLAAELAVGPTRAYAEVKALLRSSLGNGLETQVEDERQAVGRSVTTADFAEGVTAFVQKRGPRFTGS